jgi:hypothetical protein
MSTPIQFTTYVHQSPHRSVLFLVLLLIIFAALSHTARAVTPPPVGAYSGGNTATGQNALLSLATGTYNTAIGLYALQTITTGQFNTGIGAGALLFNTADQNTATGAGALLNNTTGTNNTAMGEAALFFNTTGNFNTGIGDGALSQNTTGGSNVAVGLDALPANTTGDKNTVIGDNALNSNTTGSSNTVIGFNSGFAVTTANNVVCIGAGVPGANEDNSCFIGSIFGQTSSGGTAIFINSDGKLGTTTSSKRFKEDIKPMDKTSETLFSLKPVSFRYKKEIDPAGNSQFGLVAEDVEKVNPELVVRDKEGNPYSVRYEAVNAMLLNEFLKEHHQVEDLKAIVAQQQKQIEALTGGLQNVSAQLEASKPALQVVANVAK